MTHTLIAWYVVGVRYMKADVLFASKWTLDEFVKVWKIMHSGLSGVSVGSENEEPHTDTPGILGQISGARPSTPSTNASRGASAQGVITPSQTKTNRVSRKEIALRGLF